MGRYRLCFQVWPAIDDLIAEIRYVGRSSAVLRPVTKPRRSIKSVSNSRVKSGYVATQTVSYVEDDK